MLVSLCQKKRLAHIAFKIPISEHQSFDQLIEFISKEWGKRKKKKF